MKYVAKLTFIATAILTPKAFAHKIQYDSEELSEASKSDKEKAKKTEQFCLMSGRADVEACAAFVIKNNLLEEAAECADKINSWQYDSKLGTYMHKVGGGSGESSGYWHTDYRVSKQEGKHRHEWTAGTREVAGRELAARFVEQLKRSYSEKSTTKEKKEGLTGFGEIIVKVGNDLFGSGEGKAGLEKKEENSESTTTKGPSAEEIKKAWDEGYALGKANPQRAEVNPDAMCEASKKLCSSSSNEEIVNKDYTGPSSTAPASGGGSTSGSGSSKGADNTPPPPPPVRDEEPKAEPIKSTPAGTWAGEPTKNDDDTKWADFNQENPGSSLMDACLLQAHKDNVDRRSKLNYDEGYQTPEQKKAEADAALEKGLCMAEFYGAKFCQDFKAKMFTEILADDGQELINHEGGKIDSSQLHFRQQGDGEPTELLNTRNPRRGVINPDQSGFDDSPIDVGAGVGEGRAPTLPRR